MKIKLIDNESITIEGGNGLGADQIKMSNGSTVQSTISGLVSDTNNIQGYIDDINEVIEEDEEVTAAALTNLNSAIETKQDILTAGTGITIDNNVISATGEGGGGITEIESNMPIVFGTYNESTGAYDNTYLNENDSSGASWLYDIAPNIHQEMWSGSSEEATFRVSIDIAQGVTNVYGNVLAYITPTGSHELTVSFTFEGVNYVVLFDISTNHATTTATKLSHLVANEENKFYDTGLYLEELVPSISSSTREKLSALRMSNAYDKMLLVRGFHSGLAIGTYAVATVKYWGSTFEFYVDDNGTTVHVQSDSQDKWTITRTTPYTIPSGGIPYSDLSYEVQHAATSIHAKNIGTFEFYPSASATDGTCGWDGNEIDLTGDGYYYKKVSNGIDSNTIVEIDKLGDYQDVVRLIVSNVVDDSEDVDWRSLGDPDFQVGTKLQYYFYNYNFEFTPNSELYILIPATGYDDYESYISIYNALNDYYTKSEINTALSGKQNTLTAGDGIFINNNTISANNNICRRINLYYSENTFAQDRVLSRNNYMYCYIDGEGNDFINLPITLYQIGTIKATMVLEFPLDITSAYQSAAGKSGTLSHCPHITADGNKLIIELNPNTDGEPIDTDQDHGYHTWKGLLGAIISEIMTELSI